MEIVHGKIIMKEMYGSGGLIRIGHASDRAITPGSFEMLSRLHQMSTQNEHKALMQTI